MIESLLIAVTVVAVPVLLAVLVVFLAWLFVPSIQASARRKAEGDTDEVLHSVWGDWERGECGLSEYAELVAVPEDVEPDEPVSGVIRIQAR